MSGAGRKSGGGRRTITVDEAELWERATRSLDRVKAKPRVAAVEPSPMPVGSASRASATPAAGRPEPAVPSIGVTRGVQSPPSFRHFGNFRRVVTDESLSPAFSRSCDWLRDCVPIGQRC